MNLRAHVTARVLAALGFVGAMVGACDRAPEPVPAAEAKPKLTRCMREMRQAPPPAEKVDPRCPKDEDGGPPEVPTAKIEFPGTQAPAITVEVMRTEPHRNRGLMFRKELAEDRGMLFVFSDVDVRTFWMHNTCLPLDMLFVAEDGFVAGILENVPTMNDDPRTVPCPVKHVLEVNAGFARKHGVKPGQTLRFQGLPQGG